MNIKNLVSRKAIYSTGAFLEVLYVADEALEHENVHSIVIESVNEYCSVMPHSFVMQLAVRVLSKQRVGCW